MGVAGALLQRHVQPDCKLDITDTFDPSFTQFWNEFPKQGRVLRDLSRASLESRYASHPHRKFAVAKLMRGTRLIGFLVFNIAPEHQTCFVYDLIANTTEDIECLLALFVSSCMLRSDIGSVRVTLESRHPYIASLRKLYFIRRDSNSSGVYQLHSPGADTGSMSWWINAGDKDV
jgi:hypothetical protein